MKLSQTAGMFMAMNDIEPPGDKEHEYSTAKSKVKNLKPIKKCHYLEGKYFIVIDKSIVEQLNFSNREDTELYFQQEISEQGSIIMRLHKT
jgi:hypothetical protein